MVFLKAWYFHLHYFGVMINDLGVKSADKNKLSQYASKNAKWRKEKCNRHKFTETMIRINSLRVLQSIVKPYVTRTTTQFKRLNE